MERVKKVIKKISIVFAVALMFGTVLYGSSAETEAATKLHRYFEAGERKDAGKDGSVLSAKWGFKDASGNVVIEAQYQSATSFSEGLSAVSDENGEFYINTKGERVLTVNCVEEPKCGLFRNGVAVVEGKIGDTRSKILIDKTGKRLTKDSYTTLKRLGNGCFDATTSDYTHCVLDKKGNVIIKSYSGTLEDSKYGFLVYSGNNGELVYNIKGKQILKAKTGNYTLCADTVWYQKKFGTVEKTVYNWSGKRIGKVSKNIRISADYARKYEFNSGMEPAENGKGKYGYINSKGKFVLKPVYNSAGEFAGKKALVSKDASGLYFINAKGKAITKKLASGYRITPNLYVTGTVSGRDQRLRNNNGKVLRQAYEGYEYNVVSDTGNPNSQQFLQYRINDKWGLLSVTTGKEVIPKAARQYGISIYDNEQNQYILVNTYSTKDVYELDGTYIGCYRADALGGLND